MTSRPSPPTQSQSPAVIPAPDLTRVFSPHPEGYLGADAVLSVPLPDGRTLWFWGDTLIGRLLDGNRKIASMPRNTVAIQDPGRLEPSRIRFFLYGRDGKPQSYLRFPDLPEEENWLWPGTAVCRDGVVYAICNRITKGQGPCEALSFRVLDPWLARIHVTSGDPSEWVIGYERLPWTLPLCLLSAASFIQGSWLYLLGTTRRPAEKRIDLRAVTHAILARVAINSLPEEAPTWRVEYWTAGPSGPAWSPDPSRLQPLFRPGTAETTLVYDAPRRRFLATAYRGSHPELYLVTAPALEGPWSDPIPIYTCTEGFPRERFLFYALRMHPHLAAHAEEMVLSYIVNARGWPDLVSGNDIYFPHFLRLDLRTL